MEHIVDLDSLHFPEFNYKRNPNFAKNSANIWGMGFGFFMLAAPMMGWIDFNSPTLGSILCFGGICEYLIGFYNWHQGRGLQCFMDFIFGLLHLTLYFTFELGKYSIPVPYEYHTYMQGVFYCIWIAMILFLVIALRFKGLFYMINVFLLFLAGLFALLWHFSNKTWCRKASGYFLFFSSIILTLTGLYHLLNGVFKEPLIITVLPEP